MTSARLPSTSATVGSRRRTPALRPVEGGVDGGPARSQLIHGRRQDDLATLG
jgi:hypothetical protein